MKRNCEMEIEIYDSYAIIYTAEDVEITKATLNIISPAIKDVARVSHKNYPLFVNTKIIDKTTKQ